jgi:hypothetical protein
VRARGYDPEGRSRSGLASLVQAAGGGELLLTVDRPVSATPIDRNMDNRRLDAPFMTVRKGPKIGGVGPLITAGVVNTAPTLVDLGEDDAGNGTILTKIGVEHPDQAPRSFQDPRVWLDRPLPGDTCGWPAASPMPPSIFDEAE